MDKNEIAKQKLEKYSHKDVLLQEDGWLIVYVNPVIFVSYEDARKTIAAIIGTNDFQIELCESTIDIKLG